jgi:hypothetical protein
MLSSADFIKFIVNGNLRRNLYADTEREKLIVELEQIVCEGMGLPAARDQRGYGDAA